MSSRVIKVFTKDPDSILDYVFDATEFLADGDTLKTTPLDVTSSGVTLDSASVNAASITVVKDGVSRVIAPFKAVVVWLSGGTLGVSAIVTVRMRTNYGRTIDASFNVAIVSE